MRRLIILRFVSLTLIFAITGCSYQGAANQINVATEMETSSTPMPSDTPESPPTITVTFTPTATPFPTLTPTDTYTPTPSPTPVTSNTEWTPVIQKFDSVEMALVPAGCFMMGTIEEQEVMICEDHYGVSECDLVFTQDEYPANEVCFDEPFWIDIYEVTNAQYGSSGKFEGGNLPRETVTWFEAIEHCQSRGGRLPTEAEWEYAARGPDNLIYPWGNTFDGTRLNYCDVNCDISSAADTDVDDGYRHTAPVGSYPGGVSWVGAYDMLGNVFEWTNSIYMEYPYNIFDGREGDGGSMQWVDRVLRGGAYSIQFVHMHTAKRVPFNETYDYHNIGFRCAMDYMPDSGD